MTQRVVPKSYAQAMGEVRICRIFLEIFSGNQVRTRCNIVTRTCSMDNHDVRHHKYNTKHVKVHRFLCMPDSARGA